MLIIGNTFFPTEIKSRRELAQICLVDKHQLVQIHLLDDTCRRPKTEAKQDF